MKNYLYSNPNNVIIELSQVDTIYEGERVAAIQGINLKIKKGEFLCIIGPNGAGKTTLLETINGLLECTKGQTRVFGKKIKKFGCSIRKEIGYVPQEFGVDNFTPFLVKDVIMMGRFGKIGLLKPISNKDYLNVEKAMDAMEINDLANRPIGKLSGGQLQKVMIARVLAKAPKILLLDEPFSNLDFKVTSEISYKISCLHNDKNLTTLMVMHDIASIPKRCDRIILMNSGRIIKDDRPEKILKPEFLNVAYKGKQ